jgi:hypothetical protein
MFRARFQLRNAASAAPVGRQLCAHCASAGDLVRASPEGRNVPETAGVVQLDGRQPFADAKRTTPWTITPIHLSTLRLFIPPARFPLPAWVADSAAAMCCPWRRRYSVSA